jgi:hypothetical protein
MRGRDLVKPATTWIVAVAVVLSSYIGGRRAVENRLRAPETAPRLAAEQVREHASDSVRAVQKHAALIARIRAELAERKRLDMYCARDWAGATSNRERGDALSGDGPLMTRERGRCTMRLDGAVVWIRW